MYAVEMENVSTRRLRGVALDDLSLCLKRASIVLLLGDQSAGAAAAGEVIGSRLRTRAGAVRRGSVGIEPRRLALRMRVPVHRVVQQHAGNRVDAEAVQRCLREAGREASAQVPLRQRHAAQRQRLKVALAMLGEPEVIVLHDPFTGLDADGRRWLRQRLGELRDRGRTVVLTAATLRRYGLLVDEVAVLARGRLLTQQTMPTTPPRPSARTPALVFTTPQAIVLRVLLEEAGAQCQRIADDALLVRGVEHSDLARLAARHGVVLRRAPDELGWGETVFIFEAVPSRPHGVDVPGARRPGETSQAHRPPQFS